jgi:hypothetical protein
LGLLSNSAISDHLMGRPDNIVSTLSPLPSNYTDASIGRRRLSVLPSSRKYSNRKLIVRAQLLAIAVNFEWQAATAGPIRIFFDKRKHKNCIQFAIKFVCLM